MRYNMKRNTVTLSSSTVVMFIGVIISAVVSQHLGEEGNYIVPRATQTLDLGRKTNRSTAAYGKKRICQTNFDCQGFVNNLCCKTISGFSKCRKKCKKRGRKKFPINQITLVPPLWVPQIGCTVAGTNEVYKEGDAVKAKDGCNKCICSQGNVMCTKLPCPPAKCKYKKELYNDGYRLVLHNGCKRCVCKQRFWNCTIHPCEDLKMRNSALSVAASASLVLAVIASTHFYAVT